jgi:hypothetical protein
MEHRIQFPGHKDKVRNIVADELETGLARQVRQVLRAAGDEVIHSHDGVVFGK